MRMRRFFVPIAISVLCLTSVLADVVPKSTHYLTVWNGKEYPITKPQWEWLTYNDTESKQISRHKASVYSTIVSRAQRESRSYLTEQERSVIAASRIKDSDRVPPVPSGFPGSVEEWSSVWHQNRVVVITREVTPSLLPSADAAVTFDAAAGPALAANASSVTFSHTMSASANGYLSVPIARNASSQGITISSVTHNGDAVTHRFSAGPENNRKSDYYDRIAPDTGTANVVVTFSANSRAVVGALSATGVDQSTPRSNTATAQGTSTSPSVTVTSATGEIVFSNLAVAWGTNFITTDSTWTERWNSSDDGWVEGEAATKAGATSVSLNSSLTTSAGWAVTAASIKSAPPPPTIYWTKDHIYAGPGGKEFAIITPPSSDTTVPTTPTNVASSNVTASSVQISWTGSSDSGGSELAGYKIYRQKGSGGSLPVGTVGTGTTTFVDQPLQPGTGYTWTVRAFDNAQNHSAASSSGSATTSADNVIHRRQITINSGQVPSTQSNFPVLISGTYSYLAGVAYGGLVRTAAGLDIKFTSDSAGANLLAYEQVKYVSSTGEIKYWVKLPSISNGASFYMFYGYNNATDLSNKTAVWDSSYKGVWHFDGTTLNNTSDSTANSNNGTNHGATFGSGQIDRAASFSAANSQYIEVPHSTSLNVTAAVTASIWFNTASTSHQVLFAKYSALPAEYELAINDGMLHLRAYPGNVNTYATDSALLSSYSSGWHYLVGTYDGSTMSLYVDGVLKGTTSVSGALQTTSSTLRIGGRSYPGTEVYFTGSLDEARVSSVARSAHWIQTEYNNQSAPASFYSVGPDQ